MKIRSSTSALTGLLSETFKSQRSPVGADRSVIEIDPRKTKMNPYHGRLSSTMSGEAITTLAENMKANGQTTPALGWYLPQTESDGVDVVLIYGARRRAAALAADITLKVRIIEQPSIEQLLMLMHTENAERANYFAIEEAVEFKRMMEADGIKTQEKLAEALNLAEATITRRLQLLTLPEAVLKVFYQRPELLGTNDGMKLTKLCSQNSEAKAMVVAEASKMLTQGIPDNAMDLFLGRSNDESSSTPSAGDATIAPKKPSKPPKKHGQRLFAGKASIGRIAGLVEESGDFTLFLNAKAPIELKRAIAAAIATYIKS